jgi:sec-independent protein translocase protein TatC
MPNQREDDLFRESTMTFGQHLGELRKCLFKSVVGLAIGLVVGLIVGNWASEFIQSPLTNALTKYYQKESETRVDAEVARLKSSGKEMPWTPEQVKYLVETKHMLADEYFVDPSQTFEELKNLYPDTFANVQLPQKIKKLDDKASTYVQAATPKTTTATMAADDESEGLIRIFFWHHNKDDARLQSKSMAMAEPFTNYIKVSLMVGAILASPWILFQIWQFVAAGLYPHERRYVQQYFPFSVALFLTGAALAFFVVFEPVLEFLLSFNRLQGISPEPRFNEWLSFVLILPFGFGLGFQLPLVMLFAERIGLVTVRTYLAQWRIAVLVIFVVAAILTPPDAYSMLLLSCSLTFLYFGGILLCRFMPRRASPFEANKP